jgi:hypothetical protein
MPTCSHEGTKKLFDAIKKSDVEEARRCLESKDAELDGFDAETTPLLMAVLRANPEMVKFIANCLLGAETPLGFKYSNSVCQSVEYLLKVAVVRGDIKVFEILMKRLQAHPKHNGFDINNDIHGGKSILDFAEKVKVDLGGLAVEVQDLPPKEKMVEVQKQLESFGFENADIERFLKGKHWWFQRKFLKGKHWWFQSSDNSPDTSNTGGVQEIIDFLLKEGAKPY